MRIEIGRYAGFCRGVKDAVTRTFAFARQSKKCIYTDGELIHNPQTLEMLKDYGVKQLDEHQPPDSLAGKTVIIRAHGVSPRRRQELRSRAAEVKNFTCPVVGKVQGTIKKWSGRGYSIIIFGKKDHPEVKGLLGFAADGYVVFKPEDTQSLPSMKKVLLVSQTTMSKKDFSAIGELLSARYKNIKIVNTICDATEQRQDEIRILAQRNDCLLVIGGRRSSNSRRLLEIGSQYTTTYFIEKVEDVKNIDFKGVKKLGITAGASTPDWVIDEVVEAIRRKTQPSIFRFFKNMLLFSLHSNLFVALGAFFLSFAVADNLSVPLSYDVALLVSLYYLSMSLMNSYTNRFSFKIDNPRSYNFISRFRFVFTALFLVSFGGIFFIAIPLGNEILLLTVFSVALGIAYNLSYFPMAEKWKKIFFLKTRDLLSLKSVVLAFAVTILLNGLTLLKHYPPPWSEAEQAGEILSRLGFYFSVYYVFLLMFTREVLFEIKRLQTDRIVGVSSLLNIFPKRTIRILLFLLPTLLLIAMIIGVIFGAYPQSKIKYFIAVIYNYLAVYLSINPRLFHNRTLFELMVESNLYVAGLISFI